MAMNIHQEARRRQMHMDRVCEARRKMESTNTEIQHAGAGTNGSDSDPLMCSDQGQFFQTRLPSQNKLRSIHVWTGPERNRRVYDRSREGPVLGQSWRALKQEMNFRESNLSAAHYSMPAVKCGGFQPVDAAFPRK